MKNKDYWFPTFYRLSKYNRAIRNKVQIIRIILEMTTYFNSIPASEILHLAEPTESDSYWMVHISKMSRAFIRDGDIIHSFAFPFLIKIENDMFRVSCIDDVVNSTISSMLSSVFEEVEDSSDVSRLKELYDALELDYTSSAGEKAFAKQLITYLLSFEPAYIRVDHDEKRENKEKHPLDHLDVNYSNAGTFKLGLNRKVGIEDLISSMEKETICPVIEL